MCARFGLHAQARSTKVSLMQRSSLSPSETDLPRSERVLVILESIVESESAIGVMEIAARTGIDKSAVSRAVKPLVSRRWIERDSSGFRAGTRLIELSSTVGAGDVVGRLAGREIDALVGATMETTSFHRLVGRVRICIRGLESPHIVRGRIPLGQQIPLFHGTSGKTILAFTSAEVQAAVFEEAPRDTRQKLAAEIAFTDANGYLSTENDPNQGIAALAVPVFSGDGIIGSLGIIGPSNRWTAERRNSSVETALESARRMAAAAGYTGELYARWLERIPKETL